jgi:hypothetical protein
VTSIAAATGFLKKMGNLRFDGWLSRIVAVNVFAPICVGSSQERAEYKKVASQSFPPCRGRIDVGRYESGFLGSSQRDSILPITRQALRISFTSTGSCYRRVRDLCFRDVFIRFV